MKTIVLFFSICLVAMSCQKDSTYELSAQDKSAIEGMVSWQSKATSYNDSLELCCDSALLCSDSLHRYYDDMLHYCEDRFEDHHHQFSHDADHCDHSHSGNNMMQYQMHGHNRMHRHTSGDDHGDSDYHLGNTHDEMRILIDSHCHYL